MKKNSIILTILLMVFSSISIYPGSSIIAEQDNSNDYQLIFNRIKNSAVNSEKVVKLQNVKIKRDQAEITFIEGELYLCDPINEAGQVCIFSGKGNFTLTPPLEIEQEQIYRFYQTKSINHNFETMMIICNDNTIKELTAGLEFYSVQDTKKINNDLADCIRYVFEEDAFVCDRAIIKPILENDKDGFFHAHYITDDNDDFAYQIDPYAEEEVTFSKGHSILRHYYYETINSYGLSDKSLIRNVVKDNYEVIKYTAKIKLDGKYSIHSKADISFVNKFDNQQWLRFNLQEDMEIDSVKNNFQKLNFVRGEETSNLWVNVAGLKLNEIYTISIFYQGEIFYKDIDAWIALKSPTYWLPRLPSKNKSAYDITFRFPSDMTLVASGQKPGRKWLSQRRYF